MFIVNIIFFEFVIPSNDYEYDFGKYLVKLWNYKKLNTNFKKTLVSLQKNELPTKLYIPSADLIFLTMNCSPVHLVQDLESFHLIYISISHIRPRQVTTIECSCVYLQRRIYRKLHVCRHHHHSSAYPSLVISRWATMWKKILLAQMNVLRIFFELFIVLGMNNFGRQVSPLSQGGDQDLVSRQLVHIIYIW